MYIEGRFLLFLNAIALVIFLLGLFISLARTRHKDELPKPAIPLTSARELRPTVRQLAHVYIGQVYALCRVIRAKSEEARQLQASLNLAEKQLADKEQAKLDQPESASVQLTLGGGSRDVVEIGINTAGEEYRITQGLEESIEKKVQELSQVITRLSDLESVHEDILSQLDDRHADITRLVSLLERKDRQIWWRTRGNQREQARLHSEADSLLAALNDATQRQAQSQLDGTRSEMDALRVGTLHLQRRLDVVELEKRELNDVAADLRSENATLAFYLGATQRSQPMHEVETSGKAQKDAGREPFPHVNLELGHPFSSEGVNTHREITLFDVDPAPVDEAKAVPTGSRRSSLTPPTPCSEIFCYDAVKTLVLGPSSLLKGAGTPPMPRHPPTIPVASSTPCYEDHSPDAPEQVPEPVQVKRKKARRNLKGGAALWRAMQKRQGQAGAGADSQGQLSGDLQNLMLGPNPWARHCRPRPGRHQQVKQRTL